MKRLIKDLLTNFPGVVFKMQYRADTISIKFLSNKNGPFAILADGETEIEVSSLSKKILADDFRVFHEAHIAPKDKGDCLEMMFRVENKGEINWFMEKSHVVDKDPETGALTYEGFMLNMTEKMQLRKIAQASEAKDNFLAAMSHELRTPLNAITGFLYLLSKTELDIQQRDYLTTIQTASATLLETINQVLDFSKIEAGKMQIVNKPFNMEALLEEMRAMFSQQALDKELQYHVTTVGDVPKHLLGDMFHIRQMLVNLISNAFKFTLSGGVVVRCMVEDKTGKEILLKFTVTDTGIGMDRNVMDKVFSPFSQADGNISRRHKGTGLGLSIVKSLAEMLGGTATVQSQKGAGSSFSFTCKVSEWSKKVAHYNALLTEIPQFPHHEVLLVEDNPVNRQIAAHLLQDAGLCVVEAENGLEALKLINKKKTSMFSLILMDVEMPVLDGLNATRKIRALPHMSAIPIIAMTAHTFESEIEKCIEVGMDNHICKPLNIQSFYQVLSKYLETGEEMVVDSNKQGIQNRVS